MSGRSAKKLVIGTRNQDKLREIRAILRDTDIQVLSVHDFEGVPEVEETGITLEENALLKAQAVHRATGYPALADDTGLEVDALGGMPGVYSSRYAGENATYADNVRKLLRALQDTPEKERTARFRCVAAFVDGNYQVTTEGICEGVILREPRGAGGFGYDPVFYVPRIGKTFAEMPAQLKNEISHRAMALRKMKEVLLRYFDEEGQNE